MSEMAGTCGEDSGNFIFIYLNQLFFIKFTLCQCYEYLYNCYILECITDEYCQEGLDPKKMKAWCDQGACVCMTEELPNLDEY